MQTSGSLAILVGPEDPSRLAAIAHSLAPQIDYRTVAELRLADVQQWHPSPTSLRGPRWIRLGRSFFGNLHRALRLVQSLAPGSIVYSTGETWGLPVALAGALQRRRQFIHVAYVHRLFDRAWLNFIRVTRRGLAVDGWICVTHLQADLLRQTLGPGGAPVTVISQGVDTGFFDPALAAPVKAQPYVLSVGVEMRNYNLLFDAMRSLDVDVVVKASSAWMTGGRSRLAATPPNVRVMAQRLSYGELRDLYAGAALVAVPLHETPQAAGINTILEAMAMGKCVLATQSSGLPDVLVDHRTGRIVPAHASDLGQAIATLWNEPETRTTLAGAGQQAVRAGFTIDHHARAVVDFLTAVAAGH